MQTVVLAACPIPSLAAGLLSDFVLVKTACGSALRDLANHSLLFTIYLLWVIDVFLEQFHQSILTEQVIFTAMEVLNSGDHDHIPIGANLLSDLVKDGESIH